MVNWFQYLSPKEITEKTEALMYIRDERHQPIGIAVITAEGKFGWSLVHPIEKKFDTDKGKGVLIACSRAGEYESVLKEINERVKKVSRYKTAHSVVRLGHTLIALGKLREWQINRDNYLKEKNGTK